MKLKVLTYMLVSALLVGVCIQLMPGADASGAYVRIQEDDPRIVYNGFRTQRVSGNFSGGYIKEATINEGVAEFRFYGSAIKIGLGSTRGGVCGRIR